MRAATLAPRIARSRRSIRPVGSILLAALVSVGVRGDDSGDHRRLAAMPQERRAALAEKLNEFDHLSDPDRARIRRLDRNIHSRDLIDQNRFQGLIQRYHLWVSSLPEDQRKALRAAERPEDRIALMAQIRQKSEPVAGQGLRVSGIRTGEFGLVGPYEAAFLLQVWAKLSDAKRKSLVETKGKPKLLQAIRAEAKGVGVALPTRPGEVDRIQEATVDTDPTLRTLGKRAGDPATKPAEKAARRASHPYAEFLYFEAAATRPRPVPPPNLARFQAGCPAWFLSMTDTLSGDDARSYLAEVYRLVYPFPTEMPDKPGAATTPPAAPPGALKAAAPPAPNRPNPKAPVAPNQPF